MDDKTYSEFVASLAKSGADIGMTLTVNKIALWHHASGAAGEAGEVLDEVKKHIIYNKPLDLDKLIKELGDVEFYLAGIRNAANLTREEIIDANVEKLTARFASGYSDEAAIKRKDAA